MTTGKTIALTRRTLVSKVMSLLLNMLSRLVIIFLPRSKCLLISWLQSPYAVILEPKKIKSVTASIVSPSICHEVMVLDLHDTDNHDDVITHLEPDMEQWTGFKLGKEYFKAVYHHLAYLTYMQRASCKMLGWMNHKLESSLLGELTSDMQMIPL